MFVLEEYKLWCIPLFYGFHSSEWAFVVCYDPQPFPAKWSLNSSDTLAWPLPRVDLFHLVLSICTFEAPRELISGIISKGFLDVAANGVWKMSSMLWRRVRSSWQIQKEENQNRGRKIYCTEFHRLACVLPLICRIFIVCGKQNYSIVKSIYVSNNEPLDHSKLQCSSYGMDQGVCFQSMPILHVFIQKSLLSHFCMNLGFIDFFKLHAIPHYF